MRRNEILTLKWEQVNLAEAYIQLGINTKAKKARIIFLNPILVDILKSIPKNNEYVITYKDLPIKSIKRSWATAQKNAGVGPYHFHDIRATFCTILYDQNGVEKFDVQKAAGHSDSRVTERYLEVHDNRIKNAVVGIANKIQLTTKVTNESHKQSKTQQNRKNRKP